MEQQHQPASLDERLHKAVRHACLYRPKCSSLYYGLLDIERLLDAGANPRSKNCRGETALEYVLAPQEKCRSYGFSQARLIALRLLSAIDLSSLPDEDQSNQREYFKKLRFDQLDEVDEMGCTSLHYAAFSGCEVIVEYLLSEGASPDLTGHDGNTPLLDVMGAEHVSMDSRVNIVRLLIAAGADVNKATKKQKTTSLLYACRQNSEEIVELLLSNGASVDSADKDGDKALFIAAEWANVRIVQLLIEAGADVNEQQYFLMDWHYMHGKERFPKTPLCVAVEAKKVDTVRCLLERGADPNQPQKSFSGSNGALYYILSQYEIDADRFSILTLLLSHGADIYEDIWYYSYYESPFETIVKRGSIEEMRLFLEHGVDLTRFDPKNHCRGYSVLHETIADKHKLALLLEYNTKGSLDLECLDKGFHTPLISALRRGSPDSVRMLLEAGADVNHADSFGQTPFEFGVKDSHRFKPEHVALLVEAGAKLGSILDDIVAQENDEHRMDKLKCIIKHRVLFEFKDQSVTDPLELALPKIPVLIRSYYESCKTEMAQITNFFTENAVKFCDMLNSDKDFHKRVRNEEVYKIFEEEDLEDRWPIYAKDLQQRFKNLINVHRVWEKAVEKLGQYLFPPTSLPTNFNTDAYYHLIQGVLNYLHDKDIESLAQS